MSTIDDVVVANRRSSSHAAAGLGAPPVRELAILTCMDTRIDPLAAFGLDPGDAHVLRNAGARVTDDVLRSLAASWHFLGTSAVMVVHHSDCGMLADDPDEPRRLLEQRTGVDLGDLDLLAFSDEDESVRQDVERIRRSPLLPDTAEVRGFILDLDTGLLREVGSASGPTA